VSILVLLELNQCLSCRGHDIFSHLEINFFGEEVAKRLECCKQINDIKMMVIRSSFLIGDEFQTHNLKLIAFAIALATCASTPYMSFDYFHHQFQSYHDHDGYYTYDGHCQIYVFHHQ
jgi:hypothetical protein